MRHVTTALASVVLAVLVWYYARSRDIELLQRVEVPVQLTLAPGPGQFRITPAEGAAKLTVLADFKGPRAEIHALRQRLEQGRLVVERQLPRPRPTETAPQTLPVPIFPNDFPWIPGVSVALVPGRDTVAVTLVPLTVKKLQVELNLATEDRDLVKTRRVDPSMVEVEGPSQVLARYETIATEPFDIAAAADSTEETVYEQTNVPLVQVLEGQPIVVRPPRVHIRLLLGRRLRLLTLENLPIYILAPPDFRFEVKAQSLRPTTVSIRVKGPVLQDLSPDQVKVFVDLTALLGLKPGLYGDEKLSVLLPRGFELVGDPPVLKQLEIVAPAAAPERPSGGPPPG